MKPKSLPIDSLLLLTKADGHLVLELSRQVEDEEFPRFVTNLTTLYGGSVVERTDVAEARIWRGNFGGTEVWVVLDEEEGPLVSLMSWDSKGDLFVSDLYDRLKEEKLREA